MTSLLLTLTNCWLGLCPKIQRMRTAPAVLMVQPENTSPGQPDGGSGGAAKIHRGFNIVVSGMKTLMQNRQLLWFSFLTGVIMAFVFIAQYGLRLLAVYPYDAIDFPRWILLTFVIELVAVSSFNVLLAGLILSLSQREPDKPVFFREGLSHTKGHLYSLANWSVIMALSGTVMSVLLRFSGYSFFTLFPVLRQFPFNFIFLPEVYSIGPIGGTFAMSSAITWTLTISGINAFVFIATLFVVPLLVLEKRNLSGAVSGSVSLIKKVLGEAMICVFLLILVLSVAAATSLLFQRVYGIIAPDILLMYYPGEAWIAAAVLFVLALCCLACVASTIAGIAITDLYAYGKTGH